MRIANCGMRSEPSDRRGVASDFANPLAVGLSVAGGSSDRRDAREFLFHAATDIGRDRLPPVRPMIVLSLRRASKDLPLSSAEVRHEKEKHGPRHFSSNLIRVHSCQFAVIFDSFAVYSPTDKSAIHDQIDTGTKGSGSAEQEDGRSDQFIYGGHSSERGIRFKLFTLFGHLRSNIHWCKCVARADGINPNSPVCPLHRQALGQMHYRGL